MPENIEPGVKSTAAIGGHPIHPMLIPFPIAFLSSAPVTDSVYWGTGDRFWAMVFFWLVAAGLATGLLAAIFGLIDFLTIPRARSRVSGWVHFLGNVAALALVAVSLALRWNHPAEAIVPWGLTLSVAVAVLLAVTGWLGGELSYRDKIGVIDRRI